MENNSHQLEYFCRTNICLDAENKGNLAVYSIFNINSIFFHKSHCMIWKCMWYDGQFTYIFIFILSI